MKRGVGRGAGANGNGRAIYPPGAISTVTRYRQPPPSGHSGFGLIRRILVGTLLVASSLAIALAGGAYLDAHQVVASLRAHTPGLVKASHELDVPVAHKAAIALVIGYDHRAGVESNHPSLSDTLMLIRADPVTNTISMLSFPRDLEVPIYCGATPIVTDRINSAYSRCGPKGSLLTIKHLTGLPINYLITVNFHGFKEVVDKLGGVWMDIDRRYYNKNTGAYYDNYANINLEPGYQLLSGQQALDFVRFRHTDSDLYRNMRQQQFVRAVKEQVAQNVSVWDIPSLVSSVARNIEVGEGGHSLQLNQVKSYALFAHQLPPGHLLQDRIQNVQCFNTCQASQSDVEQAVAEFTNPDVGTAKAANAAALGRRLKSTAPPPSKVSVTVLNGSGVQAAAANTSYLLGQRGYVTQVPPNGQEANAPQEFHTKIYYDPAQKRSRAAAVALQKLMQPADVARLPRNPQLVRLDPGSMLLVVLGTAYSGTISQPVTQNVPKHEAAVVRYDASSADLLRPLARKAPYPLMVPTVLERSSSLDTQSGDTPVRLYWMDPEHRKHKGVRLVYRTGANEYWGVQETDWLDAPALKDRSFRHDLGGREFDLYYNGPHLHMVVLRAHGASYWVVNTLLDSLSNETMLAIAKGLKPLTRGK